MSQKSELLRAILLWPIGILITISFLIGIIPSCTYLSHKYERWNSEQEMITFQNTEVSGMKRKEIEGKKLLAEAEWSKKIQIADAIAKREAAKALAEVEIERAKGVAEANRIIGDSLQGNEGYLRYLWIDKLGKGNQVIYVPTEASLPILEAGKRNQ